MFAHLEDVLFMTDLSLNRSSLFACTTVTPQHSFIRWDMHSSCVHILIISETTF